MACKHLPDDAVTSAVADLLLPMKIGPWTTGGVHGTGFRAEVRADLVRVQDLLAEITMGEIDRSEDPTTDMAARTELTPTIV